MDSLKGMLGLDSSRDSDGMNSPRRQKPDSNNLLRVPSSPHREVDTSPVLTYTPGKTRLDRASLSRLKVLIFSLIIFVDYYTQDDNRVG